MKAGILILEVITDWNVQCLQQQFQLQQMAEFQHHQAVAEDSPAEALAEGAEAPGKFIWRRKLCFRRLYLYKYIFGMIYIVKNSDIIYIMDIQFGRVTASGETYNTPHNKPSEGNFFNEFQFQNQNKNQKSQAQSQSQSPTTIPIRMNDLDSNILEAKSYNNVENETLRLEHKIAVLENALDKLNRDVIAFEGLSSDIQISELINRKYEIEKELKLLKQKYENLDFSTKLSNFIVSLIFNKTKKKSFKSICKNLIKYFALKFSKKFSYSESMKKTLQNLCSINESIDELIKMQIP